MTAFTELGSTLAAARKKAGRSLADLASDTGLPERYVQALEEGDMAVLPDLAYARLYYQSYARALHLDVEEVMQVWPRARKPEPVALPEPAATSRPWLKPVIALAGVAAIWVIVQMALQGGGRTEPPVAAVATMPPATAEDSAEIYDSLPVSPFVPDTGDTFDSLNQSGLPSRLMKLEVTVGQQSWVVIEADGDTVAARVLVADESLSAEAVTEFRLTATNSRGLQVELDGEPVTLDARADRPLIRYRITGKDSP
jgi:transcriptional regulator with XRE-family HTH domain